ncbi:hypothetical protein NKI19_32385, partial [Mesorhizobium sp. M0751]|uniref:hypothetical protein n=1 Tax=Mesorhizobium sp. M0751 TaxID=2956992 RepID=UPI00333B4965
MLPKHGLWFFISDGCLASNALLVMRASLIIIRNSCPECASLSRLQERTNPIGVKRGESSFGDAERGLATVLMLSVAVTILNAPWDASPPGCLAHGKA